MNGKSHSTKKQGAGSPTGSSSKNALILGAIGVVGLIVAIAVFNSGAPPRTPGQDATPTTANPNAGGANAGLSATAPDSEPGHTYGAPNPEEKPATAVVNDIVSVASLTNEVTAEDAKKFHDGLTELVRQGAASVPAIQGYLDKNLDSNYGSVKGAEELGYSSLRHALLDTLKEIGGPEAQGAMLHVLQTTAEPNEVGELAKDLESQAPGQYRDQVLEAAKEALDMAYTGQLGKDVERGPLFRVFQMYGVSYAPPVNPDSASAEAPPVGSR